MDRWIAANLAQQAMAEHGLTRRGWRFAFNTHRRNLGLCRFDDKRIELSVHYIDRNDSASVRDTILHEIAHALAGPAAGHGPRWKAWCRRLGCTPRASAAAAMPKGRWRAACPCCGAEYTRHRRPPRGGQYFCGRCGEHDGPLRFVAHDPVPTAAAAQAMRPRR